MKIIVAAAADRPAAHRRRRRADTTGARLSDTWPGRADIPRRPGIPAVVRAEHGAVRVYVVPGHWYVETESLAIRIDQPVWPRGCKKTKRHRRASSAVVTRRRPISLRTHRRSAVTRLVKQILRTMSASAAMLLSFRNSGGGVIIIMNCTRLWSNGIRLYR
jgi:hypothetical protein